MKAIAIKQPWAQLVASGYKRIIHTSNLPFDVPERVLIYASGNDPLAENDGELLPPLVRMQLENAKLLGYLTDDELPTRVLLGSVNVVGWNDREGQSWKGVDEEGADSQDYLCLGDAQIFYDPIKFENVNGSRVFQVPSMTEDKLPDSFKLKKICRQGEVLSIPCTYDFAYDICELKEYTYALYLLYNNKFLLCDEKDGELAPIKTKYIDFNSPWTTHRFKVAETIIEPSAFDPTVKQIVYKLKALGISDFKMLPQPLEAIAEVAVSSNFPVKIEPRENNNFVISSRTLEFSCGSETPDFIAFYHDDVEQVEILFSAQIDCYLPKEVQDKILKQHVGMHTPFNVQWDSRMLTVCGMAFAERGKLSKYVANQLFNTMAIFSLSLCESIVSANEAYKAENRK